MTVRNEFLGGSNWSDGNVLTAADINDTFSGAVVESRGFMLYQSSGTFSFPVPYNVGSLYVTCLGRGANGGTGGSFLGAPSAGGGGGGGLAVKTLFALTKSGAFLTVKHSVDNRNMIVTGFGVTHWASGGGLPVGPSANTAGLGGSGGTSSTGHTGAFGGDGVLKINDGISGGSIAADWFGGAGGLANSGAGGGGGAAGYYGAGGAGGQGGGTTSANLGSAATGFGAGGGGGGSPEEPSTNVGGSGSNGFILIEW